MNGKDSGFTVKEQRRRERKEEKEGREK